MSRESEERAKHPLARRGTAWWTRQRRPMDRDRSRAPRQGADAGDRPFAALLRQRLREGGVVRPARERRGGEHLPEERQVRGRRVAGGGDEVDPRLGERLVEPGDRGGPIGAVGDDLGEERIVVGRHLEPLGDAGFDPQIGAGGGPDHAGQGAGLGDEALGRIFGVDAGLDGVAGAGGRERRGGEALAGGDAELLLDQVEAGAHLGDAVLDLEAGVDLEEPDLAFRTGDELDGAGAGVAHAVHDPEGVGEERLPADLAFGPGEEGRGGGRLLDDLLVAALHAALALAERHAPPLAVAEDLHLDVLGGADVALEVDARVGEGASCRGRSRR